MKQIFLIMIGLSVILFADFSRDNNMQIVTDNSTRLQWQDDVNISKTWTGAIAYCENLTLGNHTDWRLPNENELYSLSDMSKRNPAIDSIFKNIASDYYWSSTTDAGYSDYAWAVSFYSGYQNSGNAKSNSDYVRCVRAGQ